MLSKTQTSLVLPSLTRSLVDTVHKGSGCVDDSEVDKDNM